MSGLRWKEMIVAGIVLGVTAAAIVWFLERFETRRIIDQANQVLRAHARFDEWLQEHGQE